MFIPPNPFHSDLKFILLMEAINFQSPSSSNLILRVIYIATKKCTHTALTTIHISQIQHQKKKKKKKRTEGKEKGALAKHKQDRQLPDAHFPSLLFPKLKAFPSSPLSSLRRAGMAHYPSSIALSFTCAFLSRVPTSAIISPE